MSNSTNTYGSNDLEYYYDYDPSVGGNAFFMVAFLLFGGIMTCQSIASKRYSMLYCAGFCYLEACGYLVRLLFALEDNPLKPKYYAQILLLLCAPNLLQAYCYHMLSEFIIWSKYIPETSIFKRYGTSLPYRMSMGDFIGMIIQSIGAGLLAKDDISSEPEESGKTTVVMSFVVTLITLSVFSFGFYKFLMTTSSLERFALSKYSKVLGITLLCSMIRCIYRFADIQGGSFTTGSLNKKEWSFFLFDSTCMLIPVIVMTLVSMNNFEEQTSSTNIQTKFQDFQILIEDIETSSSPGIV